MYVVILYYADHEEIIEDVTRVTYTYDEILLHVGNEVRVIKNKKIKRIEMEIYRYPKIK